MKEPMHFRPRDFRQVVQNALDQLYDGRGAMTARYRRMFAFYTRRYL